jgi:hypothetical protein
MADEFLKEKRESSLRTNSGRQRLPSSGRSHCVYRPMSSREGMLSVRCANDLENLFNEDFECIVRDLPVVALMVVDTKRVQLPWPCAKPR